MYEYYQTIGISLVLLAVFFIFITLSLDLIEHNTTLGKNQRFINFIDKWNQICPEAWCLAILFIITIVIVICNIISAGIEWFS